MPSRGPDGPIGRGGRQGGRSPGTPSDGSTSLGPPYIALSYTALRTRVWALLPHPRPSAWRCPGLLAMADPAGEWWTECLSVDRSHRLQRQMSPSIWPMACVKPLRTATMPFWLTRRLLWRVELFGARDAGPDVARPRDVARPIRVLRHDRGSCRERTRVPPTCFRARHPPLLPARTSTRRL